MKIKTAEFVISNSDYEKCPKPSIPEYAFIGRSNVGKSSLINALTGRNHLAKISGKPGKTQLINHFIINDNWYLVDLPGYGWAQVSKKLRAEFEQIINGYLLNRKNLICIFVLIDIRHSPQANDMEFMEWLGNHQLPFMMIFTKADKLKPHQRETAVEKYKAKFLETWEEMPQYFVTSSAKKIGTEEILQRIAELNKTVQLR